MDLNLHTTSFIIKLGNIDKALENIKEYFKDSDDIDVSEFETIDDAFCEFGYNLILNDEGDIVDLDPISSDLPDGQEQLFEAIEETVENGSFVEMSRDDSYWKFVFENGKVKKLSGEIVYHEKHLGYDNIFSMLNFFIDYACDEYKVREIIRWLLENDFSSEELLALNFAKDDISVEAEEIQRGKEETNL